MCPASLCDWLGVQRGGDAMGDRDVDWLDQLCEADEKIVELESENAKLRDQLRWRKWPEEKPEAEQHCQLILANNSFPHLCCSIYPFAHWEILNATHWRPIGPLPKEIE